MCHLELIFIAPGHLEDETTSNFGRNVKNWSNCVFSLNSIKTRFHRGLFVKTLKNTHHNKGFLSLRNSAPPMKTTTTVRILIRSHFLSLVFLLMQLIPLFYTPQFFIFTSAIICHLDRAPASGLHTQLM